MSAGDPFVEITGEIVGESVTLTMPLHLRVNASYRLLACNDCGCVVSDKVEVSASMIDAIGYFKASNPDELDDFGWSVAVSDDGTTLAVGARFESSAAKGINGDQLDNSWQNAGAVYVFELEDGGWTQKAYVKPSNTTNGGRFGQSVSLSANGDTLVVGGPDECSAAAGIDGDQWDHSECGMGAAYVFVRKNDAWSQQAYIKPADTQGQVSEFFGWSVELSDDGDILAVGMPFEDSSTTGVDSIPNEGASSSGAVYLFERSGDVWSQQAYVKPSNTGAGDQFGMDVALAGDGNTLAVGALEETSGATGIDGDQFDNSTPEAGAVYVFHREAGVWLQKAYIKASNTGADDEFGSCIALSGDGHTLAVGAEYEDSVSTGIDGVQVDESATDAGAVYLYVRNGDVWSQQAYIKASNTEERDKFGSSVALSGDGNVLAVAARDEDGGGTGFDSDPDDNTGPLTGAVYVYVRDGDVWSQYSYIKASNSGVARRFGYEMSISSDGGTLAVGTWGESSAGTGVGGDQSDGDLFHAGAVYLF